MQKFVLNIDKLYSGQTANALMLEQVDEELPILVPSVNKNNRTFFNTWLNILQSRYGERFDPRT